jgi:hypothetical protein
MTMNDEQRTTRRRTLVKTVKIDGDEMDLAGMADALDDLVRDEMERIEDDGGEIAGPVSISQARAVTTDYPEGSHRESVTIERGLIATITYRMDITVGDGDAD